MSTITAVVKDVTGRPDNTAWVFSSVLRESSDGDIVTTRRKTVKPVAGELSVELDPGFAIIEYGGATYFVTIPDTDTDLWALLSAAVGVPVTTPADLLAAAVETFVENNPGYPWSGISGKPDVVDVEGGLAPVIHAATAKTAPVDADEVGLSDSAASFGLKRVTVANLKAGRTRTGVYQFEHCNALTAFNNLHTRRPFMVTQKPSRFRLHIRNYDQITATYSSGALTGMTAYIGAAAVDGNGEITGAFTSTPTQIQTSTTLAAGAGEVVTGWISSGTFQIQPYAMYLVALGWTASGVQTANGGGLHFYTLTPGDAGVANPAGLTRADNQGFLDCYLEYEYQNDSAPSVLVVGNSLSGGGNVASLANRGELDAWQQQWATANGGWAASIAVGGGWTTHFAPASTRWNVYDGLAAPLYPDMVVFMGTSSSDISGGTTFAAAQSDLRAAVGKARTMWPNAQILLTTLPPRVATSEAEEIIRKQFNAWISGVPAGAHGCIDIEPVLSDGGVQMALTTSSATTLTLNGERVPRLHPDADSGDHEHWRPRGHERIANLIPLPRKVTQ